MNLSRIVIINLCVFTTLLNTWGCSTTSRDSNLAATAHGLYTGKYRDDVAHANSRLVSEKRLQQQLQYEVHELDRQLQLARMAHQSRQGTVSAKQAELNRMKDKVARLYRTKQLNYQKYQLLNRQLEQLDYREQQLNAQRQRQTSHINSLQNRRNDLRKELDKLINTDI